MLEKIDTSENSGSLGMKGGKWGDSVEEKTSAVFAMIY